MAGNGAPFALRRKRVLRGLGLALPGSGASLFRFGPYELNSHTSELRKCGMKVRLPEQSCKVLLALLQHQGELISREELQRLLWSADTFVDFEHGLNLAVRRLRQALVDSAVQPRYIETLPRRGYRFLATVEVTTPEDTPPVDETIERSAGSLSRSGLRNSPKTDAMSSASPQGLMSSLAARWCAVALLGFLKRLAQFVSSKGRWNLAVGVLFGIILAQVLFFSARRNQYPTTPLAATALTGYVGAQLCPSFSPDGEHIAFSSKGEGKDNFDIYIKELGGSTPLRITSDPKPDISPAWSPDGRSIAFVRLLGNGRSAVLLTPALPGGPENRIAELAAPDPLYEDARLLGWSADSRWLVVSAAPTTDTVAGLILIFVANGEKRVLTSPPLPYDDLDPAFSPDMKWLAFIRHSGIRAGDLYVVELKPGLQVAGVPKRLTFDHRPIGSPVWTSDSHELIFARYYIIGRHSLWRLNVSKPFTARPIPVSADEASTISISPRTHRLVYARVVKNSNIWSLELPDSEGKKNREIPRRLRKSRKAGSVSSAPPKGLASSFPGWRRASASLALLIASNREESTPSFSPDGQQIAFESSRSGWNEIWTAGRDGYNLCQITDLRGSAAGFPRWSPDGKRMLFHSRQKSVARLYTINVSDHRATPLAYDPVDDYTASWSRDGRWIYFASRRSGQVQIWKVAAQGGAAKQVTHQGGSSPFESADAAWLFYTKPNHAGIWRMPVQGGSEQLVVSALVGGSGTCYAPGRKGIYFVRQATRRLDLAFFDFRTAQVTSLAKIASDVGLGLALSTDERELLYSQVDYVDGDLMLVENFR